MGKQGDEKEKGERTHLKNDELAEKIFGKKIVKEVKKRVREIEGDDGDEGD